MSSMFSFSSTFVLACVWLMWRVIVACLLRAMFISVVDNAVSNVFFFSVWLVWRIISICCVSCVIGNTHLLCGWCGGWCSSVRPSVLGYNLFDFSYTRKLLLNHFPRASLFKNWGFDYSLFRDSSFQTPRKWSQNSVFFLMEPIHRFYYIWGKNNYESRIFK